MLNYTAQEDEFFRQTQTSNIDINWLGRRRVYPSLPGYNNELVKLSKAANTVCPTYQ